MKLILASNNAHKLREFKELTQGLDLEIISQKEAGLNLDVDETGTTFEENAFLKADAVTRLTGLPAVSDDSGLAVDALDGAPGIYSARYGYGHDASDEQRNEYLLSQLGERTDRTARYVCAVCCTFPNGDVITTRGECEGSILFSPRGKGGFGYDPLFAPADLAEGDDRTMAELRPEEKNAISHRGKAMRALVEALKNYTEKSGD